MKTFDNFSECFDWIGDFVKETGENSKEAIAKEVYEDSKEYTYIDTQAMYDSGLNSDFKNGYVVIKAPQVRWLYYTSGLQGHKNPKAVPMWFEKTKSENKDKYVTIYINTFINTFN